MDATAKKLLGLLAREQAGDVRAAAALVLGEVGEKDVALAEGLGKALQDKDSSVRMEAIKAVAKLRIESALPHLLERIKVGGEEAAAAANAAAHLGARGTRGLQELMPKVAPGLRRYIAAALGAGGTTSSETAALAVLRDTDPGVIEAAVRSLIDQVPTLAAGHRKAWTDHLLELLGDAEKRLTPVSESAMVRLLVALKDPRAENALWKRLDRGHPNTVRAAALQALGLWVEKPGKDQLKKLFACAAETDFRVAAPALMILKNQPVNPKALTDWLGLLQAKDSAARLLALEKLADRDTEAIAIAFLQQLDHADRNLREKALARLVEMKAGQAALTEATLEAETADKAWALARAQTPYLKEAPKAWREKVFTRACMFVEQEDRRADPLLYMLRETDGADLRDRLEQRAQHWRKKKDYKSALVYLRLLARDPACAFATRMELAGCHLKLSAKEMAADARAADLALQQFASLLQHHGPDLFTALEKTKWLDPEALYYLGFHFAEHEGAEKKFAAEVLKLVVQRSAKSKTGQAAKRKLKTTGLG